MELAWHHSPFQSPSAPRASAVGDFNASPSDGNVAANSSLESRAHAARMPRVILIGHFLVTNVTQYERALPRGHPRNEEAACTLPRFRDLPGTSSFLNP